MSTEATLDGTTNLVAEDPPSPGEDPRTIILEAERVHEPELVVAVPQQDKMPPPNKTTTRLLILGSLLLLAIGISVGLAIGNSNSDGNDGNPNGLNASTLSPAAPNQNAAPNSTSGPASTYFPTIPPTPEPIANFLCD
mmetsp:Transcript_23253/g.37813  ORF Transcript_23253/g.37813 Transcript_23253/m.37813 type:complete len:138 (-) Transcript_23253:1604-2017(-)